MEVALSVTIQDIKNLKVLSWLKFRGAGDGFEDDIAPQSRFKDPQFWFDASLTLLPLLTVLVAVLLLAWGVDEYMSMRWIKKAMSGYASQTEIISKNPPRKMSIGAAKDFELFNRSNPFDLTTKAPSASATEIDAFSLVGTLPNIGAWLAADGNTRLVMKGQDMAGFVLSDVQRDRVYLVKDGQVHRLLLYLSEAAPPPPKPASEATPGVQKAEEGKDGAMSRETLNKLLQNPYDELSKMRLIPRPASGDKAGGMEVVNVQPTSVLAELGVQTGDTIASLNGVAINNMGDVANAINSLMSGSRVDVRVLRDGKFLNLGYMVK